MKKILITSVGSGVGKALLDAAEHSKNDYNIIGLNSNSLSPNFSRCHTTYLCPPTVEKQKFIESVFSVVKKEKPELILAGRDEELSILAYHRKELEQLGCIVACGSLKSVLFCTDKYLTWKNYGAKLPIVTTAFSKEEIESLIYKIGFPLFAKPRKGFASRGTQCIQNKAELLAFLQKTKDPYIIQPYLQPIETDQYGLNEYSGQIIIGRQGNLLGVFGSLIAIQNNSTTQMRRLKSNSTFTKWLAKTGPLLAQMGYCGPINVQAIATKKDSFMIIEFNARCTGLTGVRAVMEFNEVDIIYREFVQKKPALPLVFYGSDSATVIA